MRDAARVETFVHRVTREAERRSRHRRAENIERAHGELEAFAGRAEHLAARHARAREMQARERMRRDHVDAFGDLAVPAYRHRR